MYFHLKKHVEALQEFKQLFQCSMLFSVVFLLEEPLLRKASQKELFQVCFQQRNRFKNHMYISTPWTLSGTLEAFLVEVKFYSGNLFRNYPRHISNRGTFSATSHTRNIVRKFNRHFQCRKNSQWEPLTTWLVFVPKGIFSNISTWGTIWGMFQKGNLFRNLKFLNVPNSSAVDCYRNIMCLTFSGSFQHRKRFRNVKQLFNFTMGTFSRTSGTFFTRYICSRGTFSGTLRTFPYVKQMNGCVEQTNQNSSSVSNKLQKADILMNNGFSVAFKTAWGKRLKVNRSIHSFFLSSLFYFISTVISLSTVTLSTCCKAILPMIPCSELLRSRRHTLSRNGWCVCMCVCEI